MWLSLVDVDDSSSGTVALAARETKYNIPLTELLCYFATLILGYQLTNF